MGVLAVVCDCLTSSTAQTLQHLHLWNIHLVWNLSSLTEITNDPFVLIFEVSVVLWFNIEVVGSWDTGFEGVTVAGGQDGVVACSLIRIDEV
jgi:hypothetical protein